MRWAAAFKNSAAIVDRSVQIDGVSLLGRTDRHIKKSMLPEKERLPDKDKDKPPGPST